MKASAKPSNPNDTAPVQAAPVRSSRSASRNDSPMRSGELKRPPSPLLTRSTTPQIKSFLLYVASERGLSENTVNAYRRDLEDLEDHFTAAAKPMMQGGADDFRGYLQSQTRQGQSTKTVARRLASIRSFLRYLTADGFDFTPVLDQLERPKPEQD